MSTAPRLDRRIVRTRSALRDALLALLETTPFEQITIAQLAEQANVTRATVYQHYASLEALFTAVVDELIFEVDARIPDEDLCMPIDNARIMSHVLAIWSMHASALRVLLERGVRGIVVERFELSVQALLTRTIRVNGLSGIRERDVAYATSFLANAAIGVFMCWSRRGFVESPAEIESLVAEIVGPGIERLLRARRASC